MDKKNKMFISLLVLAFFAIIIGSIHKVNGNEYAYISLLAGLIMKTTAIISLIVYNWAKIRMNFK